MKRAALFVLLAGHLWAAGPAADFAAAETLYLQRDFAAARAAFEQLAATEPARTSHRYFLGKIAIRERRFPEAVALLRAVVDESPGNADYQHWLGNAHAWSAAEAKNLADRAAHARRSLAAYRRAVQLAPDNVPARLSLINLLRHVPTLLGGGIARARAEAAEVERRDPQRGAYARALLLAHEGRYDDALATLRVLLADQPDYYAANLLVGHIASRSGRGATEARAALERCLRLTPTEFDEPHDVAHELLAALARPTAALVATSD